MLYSIISCNYSDISNHSKDENNTTYLESIKYKNFIEAVERKSTFNFFIVVKIKDLNTNLSREICCKGPFLLGALAREYKIGYDSSGIKRIYDIARSNNDLYFEFKDTSALNNLGIYNYSETDFKKFEQNNNIDSLILSIKDQKWNKWFQEEKEMLLYAHAFFNRGILTGEYDCWGGTLYYIDKEWFNRMKTPIKMIE